jgi:hypothetical protein
MNPIDNILSRLDKVKPNGAGKWLACCPAHADKNPSLSIKESDDGTVLLKCWAGCTAADITASVSLDLRDLFTGHKSRSIQPSRAARQFEAMVITVAVEQMRLGKQLSAEDQERLELAKRRLGGA